MKDYISKRMDFTLKSYKLYLEIIINKGYKFILFKDYINNQLLYENQNVCLIRHDVDRKPINSLKMAKLEKELGICSTYYFRIKKSVFNKKIISKISNLGHEIGYHYENLSDFNGNFELALNNFEYNLDKIRNIVEVKTCSMHGRPLSKYDNRDIWKDESRHDYLIKKLNMLGEIYLDIDYSKIAYINDTGRNWSSYKSNNRDFVNSEIKLNLNSQQDLINYLKNTPNNLIVFQIHPERWTDNKLEWLFQLLKDYFFNFAKKIINLIR